MSHLFLISTAAAFNYTGEILANAARKQVTPAILAALGTAPQTNEKFRQVMQTILPL